MPPIADTGKSSKKPFNGAVGGFSSTVTSIHKNPASKYFCLKVAEIGEVNKQLSQTR